MPELTHTFSGTGCPHFMGVTDWQRPETIAGAFKIVGGYEDEAGRVVILSNGEGKEWAVDGPDVGAIRKVRPSPSEPVKLTLEAWLALPMDSKRADGDKLRVRLHGDWYRARIVGGKRRTA